VSVAGWDDSCCPPLDATSRHPVLKLQFPLVQDVQTGVGGRPDCHKDVSGVRFTGDQESDDGRPGPESIRWLPRTSLEEICRSRPGCPDQPARDPGSATRSCHAGDRAGGSAIAYDDQQPRRIRLTPNSNTQTQSQTHQFDSARRSR
jgi:hypothetical protein